MNQNIKVIDTEIVVTEVSHNNLNEMACNEGVATEMVCNEDVATEMVCNEDVATEMVCNEGVATEMVCNEGVATEMVCNEGVATEMVCNEGVATEMVCNEGVATEMVCNEGVATEATDYKLMYGAGASAVVGTEVISTYTKTEKELDEIELLDNIELSNNIEVSDAETVALFNPHYAIYLFILMFSIICIIYYNIIYNCKPYHIYLGFSPYHTIPILDICRF